MLASWSLCPPNRRSWTSSMLGRFYSQGQRSTSGLPTWQSMHLGGCESCHMSGMRSRVGIQESAHQSQGCICDGLARSSKELYAVGRKVEFFKTGLWFMTVLCLVLGRPWLRTDLGPPQQSCGCFAPCAFCELHHLESRKKKLHLAGRANCEV